MNLYPVDMIDLIEMFPNEDSCLEYLSMIRWPDGYVCTRCDSHNSWKMSSGLYRCRECRYTSSVTAGTLFHDTRKPLFLWFQAIWYVVNQKNGVSALGLQKALGLGSYNTAWEWLHKLRRAMVRPNRDKLNGVIEMDETFIGGVRSGKRGRGAEGKSLVWHRQNKACAYKRCLWKYTCKRSFTNG
jgi:transposase-like protein